ESDKDKYCFIEAEDGIRYRNVTGVQTCALPISAFVLVLSIVVISKGYGYKHKIDKIDSADPHQTEDQTSKERDERINVGVDYNICTDSSIHSLYISMLV